MTMTVSVNPRMLTMTDIKTSRRLSFGNFNFRKERTTGVKKEKGRETEREKCMENIFSFFSPISALEPDVRPETYFPLYLVLCTPAFAALIGHYTRIYTK